jgi:hypothetical protein
VLLSLYFIILKDVSFEFLTVVRCQDYGLTGRDVE